MQYKDDWLEFHPWNSRARTRFPRQAHPFSDTHFLQHAKIVDVTYKNSSIYVILQATPSLITADDAPPVTNLQDLYRDLTPELQRIVGTIHWPAPQEILDLVDSLRNGTAMGVSDGSVRTFENWASHAWILHALNGSAISGNGPVDGSLEARTAMFIVLSLILQYFQLAGVKLATFCDNQAVVQKVKSGWNMWRFCHTKGPDGDLQALLRETLNKMTQHTKFQYSSEWVKAHQDDDVKDLRSLSRESALNVQMDAQTKAAYALPAQWQTRDFVPVLQAEGCALLEHWYEKEAKEYLKQRHGFPTEVISFIYWPSMRYALKKFSPHRRATAVKTIHRHLPTQEKLFKQGRIAMSSVCPRCIQMDETNSHIYCCPNKEALQQRKEDWGTLWKELH